MKSFLNKYKPLVIILGTIIIVFFLIISKSDVKPVNEYLMAPLVEVQEVVFEDINISIFSQGTVKPEKEILLSSEIGGTVNWISEKLLIGSRFKKDDILLTFDNRDLELALIIAESNLAQAILNHERELAEYELANKEWHQIGNGDGTNLALRKPQLNRAKALLSSAEATFELAKRNLEKSIVIAPFNGVVRNKYVDIGSVIGPGIALAQIFSIDYVEIELPINNNELQFLFEGSNIKKNKVKINHNSKGIDNIWLGEIDRISNQINYQTRMLSIFAKIENPYKKINKSNLKVGMFVNAEIIGKQIKNSIRVPRNIIKNNQLWLVNNNKLEKRIVEIKYFENDDAIIVNSLKEGEIFLLTKLSLLVDGMEVRIKD